MLFFQHFNLIYRCQPYSAASRPLINHFLGRMLFNSQSRLWPMQLPPGFCLFLSPEYARTGVNFVPVLKETDAQILLFGQRPY